MHTPTHAYTHTHLSKKVPLSTTKDAQWGKKENKKEKVSKRVTEKEREL